MRQRRRVERGNFSQSRDLSQPVVSRRTLENRQRQLLWAGAAIIIIAVVGLIGYGWFSGTFQPPRKTVANIGGEPVKLADLVTYTALDSFDANGTLRPAGALNNLVRDRVIAKQARTIGITVTDAEIDQNIIERFDPQPPDATEIPDALSEVGRTALEVFLAAVSITEDEYREWLRGRIYLNSLQTHFTDQVPDSAEQVFVEWIITTLALTAQEALDRLANNESFADLADELTGETPLSGGGGVVGWVPQGAIPELDPLLFALDLELDAPMGPLSTSLGSMILMVTEGPEEQPVTQVMQDLLGTNGFQIWLDASVVDAVVEDLGLTQDDIDWVIEQII